MAEDLLYISIFTWYYICHRFFSVSHSLTFGYFDADGVMLLGARNTAKTQSASLSLAPVSHRWVGLLMRDTLLHKLGYKCWLCRAKDDEKCAGGMPGLIFTFCFAYGVSRSGKKRSFKNTLGLLADERRHVARACWAMIISSHFLYGGKSCESLWGDKCTTAQSIFYRMTSLANQSIFDCVPSRICYTFTIMASSVNHFTRQSEFRAWSNWPKEFFYLGKAQGDRCQPEEDLFCRRRRRRWCNVDGMMTFQVSSDTFRQKWTESLRGPQKKAAWGATGTSNIQFASS